MLKILEEERKKETIRNMTINLIIMEKVLGLKLISYCWNDETDEMTEEEWELET